MSNPVLCAEPTFAAAYPQRVIAPGRDVPAISVFQTRLLPGFPNREYVLQHRRRDSRVERRRHVWFVMVSTLVIRMRYQQRRDVCRRLTRRFVSAPGTRVGRRVRTPGGSLTTRARFPDEIRAARRPGNPFGVRFWNSGVERGQDVARSLKLRHVRRVMVRVVKRRYARQF